MIDPASRGVRFGEALMRTLARRRVAIGFVSAVVVLWLAHPTRRSLAAGAIVGAAGELIRIWAAGHLEKGREVTRSGPYRFTRHPLYLGSTVMGVGLAMASARATVAAIVVVYLAATLTAAIRREEAHLTEKFGGEYPAYRRGAAAASRRRFSLRRAMANREYRAALGLLAVLALLAWKTL
ncbi:MAG TPA: isoprenylcysteine carboxylmethyltransferase family protein [Vicinamibacterales bacterium]|nr:isoprenylcysteine carboxylmethyltransferase family protein [Vicinamibacterales bacterium]